MTAATPLLVAPKPKFYAIDVVRGVATCLVALAHVAYLTPQDRWGGRAAFGGALEGLYICVDFFFVLSGFLIAWVHWKDIGVPSKVGTYFKRRLSRIYPVYWIVLALYIVGQLIMPSTTRVVTFDAKTVVTSFLIIPNDGGTLLGVAWTLYYEIIGYLVFAGMLIFGRKGVYAVCAWAAAILVINCIRQPTMFPASFYLHPYHLQFLMGIAAAAFLKKGWHLPMPRLVAGLGAIAFLAMIYIKPETIFGEWQLPTRVVVGGIATLIILGLIEAELNYGFRIPQWMQTFGVASYSIYLTHTLIESPVMKAGWPVFRHLPAEIWIFIVAGIAIVVGYIFHRMVELPATEWVKRHVLRDGGTSKPAILTPQ